MHYCLVQGDNDLANSVYALGQKLVLATVSSHLQSRNSVTAPHRTVMY